MNKRLLQLALATGLVAVFALSGGCLAPIPDAGDGTTGDFASSIWPMLIFIVLLFGLMYFLLIRPQRRRQREHQNMISELQRGDDVITAGGIYGKIESANEENVILKIESGGTIRVARSSVITRQKEPEQRFG